MWGHRYVGLYRCGNIEMQLYTDVGTQRCGAIHRDVGLWEHRAVGLYSCGILSLSLSLSIYIYICVCVCVCVCVWFLHRQSAPKPFGGL